MKLTQIETKIVKQKNGKEKQINIVKEIDYQITGYEFPNEKPSTEEFNYDANWLNDKITFNGKVYSTAGVLTDELLGFVNDLQAVIDGKFEFCELCPIEPGLRMTVKKVNDKFIFTILLGIQNQQTVSQLLGRQELIEKLEELKVFLARFPVR